MRRQLIVTSLSIATLAVLVIAFLYPVIWQQIQVNFLYWFTLILTYSVAALLVREMIWHEELPPIWYWLLLFNVMGGYYAYFGQPDVLNLFWEFIFSQMAGKKNLPFTTGYYVSLLWALAAWAGFILIAYYLQNLLFQAKENLPRFALSCLVFLFYLNLVILVIQPYFGRY